MTKSNTGRFTSKSTTSVTRRGYTSDRVFTPTSLPKGPAPGAKKNSSNGDSDSHR